LNGKGDWNIGKTGYALSAAGVQAIWDALTSALTTVGSIGKLLVDNINATISSRAPSSTAVSNADYTAARAAKLDNLDVAVSTRLATAGYTVPPTVAAIRTEMDTNSTKLANLDAAVSTRLASAGYTAPDNAGIATAAAAAASAATDTATIKAKTNSLTFTLAGKLDVNVLVVNGITVQGTGAAGDEWRPV
jgi:hypothetical protein